MSIGHISNCSKSNIDQENSIQRETKNHEIGMRIARCCYSTYKAGKSKCSFEVEVLKLIQDGLDMVDKDKVIGSLSSSRIIKDFLSTELNLYNGVGLSIQGILCAAVEVSVESVVESLVSRYEVHFDKAKQLKKMHCMRWRLPKRGDLYSGQIPFWKGQCICIGKAQLKKEFGTSLERHQL